MQMCDNTLSPHNNELSLLFYLNAVNYTDMSLVASFLIVRKLQVIILVLKWLAAVPHVLDHALTYDLAQMSYMHDC